MKVLITGVSGFAGSHLADYLLQNVPEVNVCGLIRSFSTRENIAGKKIELFEGDLRDYSSVLALIKTFMPDYILHLAANTNVPISFTQPMTFLQDNCVGTIHLLEAIRFFKDEKGYNPIILHCSSSEVYGKVEKDELPITEKNALRPLSPYGVSKCSEELYALQYVQSWNMKIVVSRAFSHTGPRRNPVFAVSNFCKQFIEIEIGLREPILYVGNLDSVRTFANVADICRAYWTLVTKCSAGVYNICGNDTMTIREIIDKISNITGITVKTEIDPKRLRPSDVVIQIPSDKKFRDATGWQPEISFEKTLKDLLDYWRYKVKCEQLLKNISK